MDFARRQLEKYGWKDGKGLGRHENGISVPIKPKLKRNVAGIGHDQAAELTDRWWDKLYDKAVKNIEVEEKNGKTKKIKTKDDKFQITNSSYHLNKSDWNDNEEYSDFFVKKAVLSNGGGKEEKVRESESEEEREEKEDGFKMTDEELFAACGGRTAHKGARHGLRATGKLARIERQEKALLTLPKYTGYSHTKKHKKDKSGTEMDLDVIENTNLNEEVELKHKKKKKKHKHCFKEEKILAESLLKSSPEKMVIEMSGSDGQVSNHIKNSKRSTQHDKEEIPIKKRKKLNENVDLVDMEVEESTKVEEIVHKIKKNKKKKK